MGGRASPRRLVCCRGRVPSPRERTRQAAYAEHLAEVQRARWRLGRRGNYWCVARRDHAGTPWTVLDETLEAFDDIDPAAERRRILAWLYELIGVRSVVLDRDRTAAAAGRHSYAVIVQR